MSEQKFFQRHQQNLLFQNEDLDFYLQMIVGYGAYGGSTLGECLFTASTINEKKTESWVSAWKSIAERVEQDAVLALEKGHEVSARESFLRALTYYRAADLLIPPSDDELRQNWQNMNRCFLNAGKLFDPPFETLEITVDEYHLVGHFVPAKGTGQPCPTLIMIGGGETYGEELYFWVGEAGRRRGYNVFLAALPAQPAGAIQGVDTKVLFERYGVNGMIQRVVQAYTDQLVSRKDVDPEKIVGYGISGGGYFITAAGCENSHLKAIAASTPIINLYKVVESEWPAILRRVPRFISNAVIETISNIDSQTRTLLQKILWASNVDNVGQYMDLVKGKAEIDPREISIPMLCMAAGGDPLECIRQTHETYDLLPNPQKAKRIFSVETGADAHCHINNLYAANQVMFDWFDEVLV